MSGIQQLMLGTPGSSELITATGGSVTQWEPVAGQIWKVHRFYDTYTGPFKVTNYSSSTNTIYYAIVGGGQGGYNGSNYVTSGYPGANGGDGGKSGPYRNGNDQVGNLFNLNTDYSLTLGSGGASNGGTGTNSSLVTKIGTLYSDQYASPSNLGGGGTGGANADGDPGGASEISYYWYLSGISDYTNVPYGYAFGGGGGGGGTNSSLYLPGDGGNPNGGAGGNPSGNGNGVGGYSANFGGYGGGGGGGGSYAGGTTYGTGGAGSAGGAGIVCISYRWK